MEGSLEEWREVGGVRFSQAEVSTVFGDNRHVLHMVKEWIDDRRKLESGEVRLEVVNRGDEVVSLNNRRLLAAKILKHMVGTEVWMPVEELRDERKLQEIQRRIEARARLNMEKDDSYETEIEGDEGGP